MDSSLVEMTDTPRSACPHGMSDLRRASQFSSVASKRRALRQRRFRGRTTTQLFGTSNLTRTSFHNRKNTRSSNPKIVISYLEIEAGQYGAELAKYTNADDGGGDPMLVDFSTVPDSVLAHLEELVVQRLGSMSLALAGTLWTTPGQFVGRAVWIHASSMPVECLRGFCQIKATAAFGGIKIGYPTDYVHFEDNYKEEFIAKFPHSKIPAWEGSDGFRLNRQLRGLATINSHLATRTFLVGERITLADIYVPSLVLRACGISLDTAQRVKLPHLMRFLETIVNQPVFAGIFPPIPILEKARAHVAPKKSK
ncbi:hypothetical protein DFH09DRAFT_1286438 [Mycena vulgaris]|nr:hypothetical protein DFH09DRAFT_1286438 [Mycena vulgaris]